MQRQSLVSTLMTFFVLHPSFSTRNLTEILDMDNKSNTQTYSCKNPDESLDKGPIKPAKTRLESEIEKRKEAEALLETFFNRSPIGLCIVQNGKIISSNPRLCAITGYTKDELSNMDPSGLVYAKDKNRTYGNVIKRLKGELSSPFELRIINRAGEIRWIVQAITSIQHYGNPAAFGYCMDITARKEAEKALRISEQKYRSILEGIEDGYYECDLQGNLTFFNSSYCKITGFCKDELTGMNFRRYVDDKNSARIIKTFDRIFTTGKSAKEFDWEITRKDGIKRHVEASISLIKDSEQRQIGFRGIVHDFTKRKLIYAELGKTRGFLQNILDSMSDNIMTTDYHGIIVYASPMVKNMLGFEPGEMEGQKIYRFYANGVEDARIIMDELKEKSEIKDHELKLKNKDGGLITINLSGAFLRNEEDNIIGTFGIFRDITEEKRLEAMLRQAQKMEAIGTLAGGIAHDFNNLLMGIQGYTSLMLLDVDQSSRHYEKLKNIEHQVESGSKLTSQLLGYARKGRYEVKPIDLNILVKKTADTFSRTKKGVNIQQELSDDLLAIEADIVQIEQVLLNLMINAADAMPGNGILTLKTTSVTGEDMEDKQYQPKPGDYALLMVIDTGTGMDNETIKKIFDPFFTTKEMGRGTGLGLASVYGILKGHGGYIDVESKKGQGSTFKIYLPLSEKNIEETAIKNEQAVKGAGTIILVDDESMILQVAAEMLRTLNYKVITAKSGKEAVKKYKENMENISLVILDMIMPEMGGGAVYDSLKKINKNIKVILSSGYCIEGEATEILKRGCNGFIQKPFNIRSLSNSIQSVLSIE